MRRWAAQIQARPFIQAGIALGAAAVVFLLARAAGEGLGGALALSAAVLLAAAGWWAALAWRRSAQARAVALQSAQDHLATARRSEAETRRRLDLLLRVNRSVMEARDEKTLMDTTLAAINGLVGAIGCSFVPVDEWDQPLPAFTYGQLPEPVLQAWAGHLANSMLRERCGSCSILHSTPGRCPLHPQEVGDSLTVFCTPVYLRSQRAAGDSLSPGILPVTGGQIPVQLAPCPEDQLVPAGPARKLGVLNLYLPAGRTLDDDTGRFLSELLRDIAPAIESARLRDQEMATLRQLQMLHAPESGLPDLLGGLLENLQQALDAGTVWLRLRPSQDERLSGLSVQRGPSPLVEPDAFERIFQAVMRGETVHSPLPGADRPTGGAPAWLALPLRLPDGCVLGMLLVGRPAGLPFHPRQEVILTTVAAQAALLVENERMLRSMEYRAVIQERTRLAREIHDGLAQTLAFLKLQAAQMQSYLAQGDLARLSQVLKDNYQVLAEAYLDTRQAIDNLRLTPRDDMVASLERIAADFEPVLDLPIERNFQPVSTEWTQQLTPEVQAQLLRIVQEALNNVRKHARAQRVWINLHEWQEELRLEVGDDGQGFDAGDVPEVSHHGLRGMRERSEIIGADFQIISQARQGTLVRLALPAYKETLR